MDKKKITTKELERFSLIWYMRRILINNKIYIIGCINSKRSAEVLIESRNVSNRKLHIYFYCPNSQVQFN